MAENVIRNRLATISTSGIDWATVREASYSLSHAELTSAAESAAKTAILSGNTVTTESLVQALCERLTDSDH